MKIQAPFRSWHAMLALVLLTTPAVYAQDGTGNKPEMSSPSSAMGEHARKEKIPSTRLTISLKSETPARLPAAGGSLSLGDKTLTLTSTDFAALPHETVTVTNGHTNATETYSGVPISVLLARLGLPFEKANEHTLLKTYFIAEGTDGYRVLISTYEALAAIRGTSAIVADTIDSKPLSAEGAFKLVVPGDKRPQRWVQNLKSITFKTID